MSDKHTPGPLEVRHAVAAVGMGRTTFAIQVIDGGNTYTVGHQDWITGDVISRNIGGGLIERTLINQREFIPECPTNALRIASSNELLGALSGMIGLVEFIIPMLEGWDRICVEYHDSLHLARQVVAKATP